MKNKGPPVSKYLNDMSSKTDCLIFISFLPSGCWSDEQGSEVPLQPYSKQVLNWDTKLYGGQQFERLLADFKAITSHMSIKHITADEIATSSGLSGVRHISNHVWSVSGKY
jgi:hypothetical protein